MTENSEKVRFINSALQTSGIQCEEPERILFTDTVNQWTIFDTYKMYEELRDRREKEEEAEEEDTGEDIKTLR